MKILHYPISLIAFLFILSNGAAQSITYGHEYPYLLQMGTANSAEAHNSIKTDMFQTKEFLFDIKSKSGKLFVQKIDKKNLALLETKKLNYVKYQFNIELIQSFEGFAIVCYSFKEKGLEKLGVLKIDSTGNFVEDKIIFETEKDVIRKNYDLKRVVYFSNSIFSIKYKICISDDGELIAFLCSQGKISSLNGKVKTENYVLKVMNRSGERISDVVSTKKPAFDMYFREEGLTLINRVRIQNEIDDYTFFSYNLSFRRLDFDQDEITELIMENNFTVNSIKFFEEEGEEKFFFTSSNCDAMSLNIAYILEDEIIVERTIDLTETISKEIERIKKETPNGELIKFTLCDLKSFDANINITEDGQLILILDELDKGERNLSSEGGYKPVETFKELFTFIIKISDNNEVKWISSAVNYKYSEGKPFNLGYYFSDKKDTYQMVYFGFQKDKKIYGKRRYNLYMNTLNKQGEATEVFLIDCHKGINPATGKKHLITQVMMKDAVADKDYLYLRTRKNSKSHILRISL